MNMKATIQQMGQGSGFLISKDGYILTNHHVVGDADKITVKLQDGREFDAERVGTDAKSEVAVIKIKGKNFPYLKMGDSNAIRVGEWVIAIGRQVKVPEAVGRCPVVPFRLCATYLPSTITQHPEIDPLAKRSLIGCTQTMQPDRFDRSFGNNQERVAQHVGHRANEQFLFPRERRSLEENEEQGQFGSQGKDEEGDCLLPHVDKARPKGRPHQQVSCETRGKIEHHNPPKNGCDVHPANAEANADTFNQNDRTKHKIERWRIAVGIDRRNQCIGQGQGWYHGQN